jgi:hypothetical protein
MISQPIVVSVAFFRFAACGRALSCSRNRLLHILAKKVIAISRTVIHLFPKIVLRRCDCSHRVQLLAECEYVRGFFTAFKKLTVPIVDTSTSQGLFRILYT